jgi:TusA-related sulfurtransferase
MRMTLVTLLAGTALLLAPACKKEEETATKPETPDTAPTEKPVEPDKPPEAATDQMVNKMAHCPSALKDTETKIEQAKESVMVTVTAKDEATVGKIRERAKHLAGLEVKAGGEVKHTGGGTGGGKLGKCPVAPVDGVEISAEDTEGGSKVTIKAKDEAAAGEAAKMAQERLDALRAHGSGKGSASGGGRGEGGDKGHGSGSGGGGSGGHGGDGSGGHGSGGGGGN